MTPNIYFKEIIIREHFVSLIIDTSHFNPGQPCKLGHTDMSFTWVAMTYSKLCQPFYKNMTIWDALGLPLLRNINECTACHFLLLIRSFNVFYSNVMEIYSPKLFPEIIHKI